MRSLLVLCVLGCVASCGKRDEVCRRDAEQIGTMLRKMDSSFGVPSEHVKLVERTDLALTVDGADSVIELGPDGAWGSRSDSPEPVMTVVDAERTLVQSLRALYPERPVRPVHLAIDGATPWTDVVDALTMIRKAGSDRVSIVFARPSIPQQRPPRTWIDERIDALAAKDPSAAASEGARLFEKVVKDCRPMRTVFDNIVADSAAQKLAVLVQRIPLALVECDCQCDLGALRSILWWVMANRYPTTTLTVLLDESGDVLELPGSTPWREAGPKLAATSKALRARVAP